jgi:hypothetical protein
VLKVILCLFEPAQQHSDCGVTLHSVLEHDEGLHLPRWCDPMKWETESVVGGRTERQEQNWAYRTP